MSSQKPHKTIIIDDDLEEISNSTFSSQDEVYVIDDDPPTCTVKKKRRLTKRLVISTLREISKSSTSTPTLAEYQKQIKKTLQKNFTKIEIKTFLLSTGLKWKKIEPTTSKTEKRPIQLARNKNVSVKTISNALLEISRTSKGKIPSLRDYQNEIRNRFNRNLSKDKLKILLKMRGLEWLKQNDTNSLDILTKIETEDIDDKEFVQPEFVFLNELHVDLDPVVDSFLIETNIKFQQAGEIPTLEYIFDEIVNTIGNIYSKEAVKKLLESKNIAYREVNKGGVDKSNLPTLEYFVNLLKDIDVNCSTQKVEQWLLQLGIEIRNQSASLNPESTFIDSHLSNFLKNANQQFIRARKFNLQLSEITKESRKIIKNIEDTFAKSNQIPTLDYIHKQLRFKNIALTEDEVEKWLNVLGVTYSHGKMTEKHDTLLTQTISEDPSLDKFYKELNNSDVKVESVSALQRWLDLLGIKYNNLNNNKPEKKNKEILTLNIVDKLLYLNKYLREPLKYPSPELMTILKEVESKFKKKNKVPTLNFIHQYILSFKLLKPSAVYCRERLKEWLTNLHIDFRQTEVDNTSTLPKTQIPPLDYFHKGLSISCSKSILYMWLKITGIDFESSEDEINQGTIFKALPDDMKQRLIKLDKGFVDQCISTNTLSQDTGNVPSLDYYFNKLTTLHGTICSKRTLAKWLKQININFTSDFVDTGANPEEDKSTLTSPVIKTLVNIAKHASLADVEDTFKKLSSELLQIENTAYYQKKLFEIKGIKYTDSAMENWLDFIGIKYRKKRNIKCKAQAVVNPTVENSTVLQFQTKSKLWVPNLDYFYESLRKVQIYCSKFQLNIWLKGIGIDFEYNNPFVEDPGQQILLESTKTKLLRFDRIYRERYMLKYIHVLEREFNKKNQTLKLNFIHSIVLQFNRFSTQKYYEKKKDLIDWLNKEKVTYFDEKLTKEQILIVSLGKSEELNLSFNTKEIVAPLSYYYTKLTSTQGNICSKETLADWLAHIPINFKPDHDTFENCTLDEEEAPLTPTIICCLKTFEQFYTLSDVETIFKDIEVQFSLKGEIPSIKYLQELLFKITGYKLGTNLKKAWLNPMRIWLDFVGVKYTEIRKLGDFTIEKYVEQIFEKQINALIANRDLQMLQETNLEDDIDEVDPLIITEKEIMELTQENNGLIEPKTEIEIEEHDLSLEENDVSQEEHDLSLEHDVSQEEPSLSPPGLISTYLRDVESYFEKINQVPSIEDFYKPINQAFGASYTHEMIKTWLIHMDISFTNGIIQIVKKVTEVIPATWLRKKLLLKVVSKPSYSQSEKVKTGSVMELMEQKEYNTIQKSNAQKQKEYRERKKINQAQNSNSSFNNFQGKSFSTVRKTPSQYMKEYRARKISKDSTFKEKEAQRLKEYRERRKMSEECLSPSSSQERSKFKETEAQRLKEYRKRKKMSEECQSPSSSQETRKKVKTSDVQS